MKHFIFVCMVAMATVSIVSTTTSCKKEEVVIDSSQPNGNFSAMKSGTIAEQNMSGSKGAASLGTDASGVQFLKFSSDFTTVFATGTVSVYLSTSNEFKADPGKGNPDLKLIGPVFTPGEHFFKIAPKADAKFTHVILWCGSANVPFGYAELK